MLSSITSSQWGLYTVLATEWKHLKGHDIFFCAVEKNSGVSAYANYGKFRYLKQNNIKKMLGSGWHWLDSST